MVRNRIAIEVSPATRTSVKQYTGEKKEETGTVIQVGQHIPAAYSEIFFIGR
jgi:hypothetical protein